MGPGLRAVTGTAQGEAPRCWSRCHSLLVGSYNIKEIINASPLLCHAIEIRLHCLLIKRVYLRCVGNAAVLVNLLSHLLNGGKPTAREKDRGPLGRKLIAG